MTPEQERISRDMQDNFELAVQQACGAFTQVLAQFSGRHLHPATHIDWSGTLTFSISMPDIPGVPVTVTSVLCKGGVK